MIFSIYSANKTWNWKYVDVLFIWNGYSFFLQVKCIVYLSSHTKIIRMAYAELAEQIQFPLQLVIIGSLCMSVVPSISASTLKAHEFCKIHILIIREQNLKQAFTWLFFAEPRLFTPNAKVDYSATSGNHLEIIYMLLNTICFQIAKILVWSCRWIELP